VVHVASIFRVKWAVYQPTKKLTKGGALRRALGIAPC